jgi:two-component system response regulator AlgR
VRALEKHHDADEGAGWAVRLDGVDEPLFVSRRQLAAVREMLAG